MPDLGLGNLEIRNAEEERSARFPESLSSKTNFKMSRDFQSAPIDRSSRVVMESGHE